MSPAPAVASCVQAETVRPDSAFTSVAYHFGMLLGVEDFETEQGYHRGKMRLHNGWLHGAGVVWGFGVTADVEHGELRVGRGLAIDPAGRELYLPVDVCVDVGAWYERHADDADLQAVLEEDEAGLHFPAGIELRYCECASRQVPAIADPCEGADRDTAYSRLQETVDVRLVLDPRARPEGLHPLLRILFGLQGADDSDPDQKRAGDARAAVLASPPESRIDDLLTAFRDLAAHDTAALRPPDAEPGDPPLTRPARDDEPLTIAKLGRVDLRRVDGGFELDGAEIDISRRLSLLPTATVQELLCGMFCCVGEPAPGSGPSGPGPAPADAGGPRGIAESVTRGGKTVTFKVDERAPLSAPSVHKNAFEAAAYGDSGWSSVGIAAAGVSDDGVTVALELSRDPGPVPIRLVASGTGRTPLLGIDLVPLAGGLDSPAGTTRDGHDFVVMIHP